MSPMVPLDRMEQIAVGIDHAEGICVAPDGTLYVSGEAGQIYSVDEAGVATVVASTGGFGLGLAADGAGRVYMCDSAKRAVMRWTPGGGDPEVWTTGAPGAPFLTPNWGAFGPDGSYFVTDSGGWKARDGRVLVVRPGRGPATARTALWTDGSADFPNGLALTPDGRELWVLESTPGRLVAFDIRADGSAGPRRVVVDLPGTVPDGLAFAQDGSVVIACYRPDIVYRWSATGGVEVLAHDPEGTILAAPTNVAFTGSERDAIVVPNIGRWHATRFRVPGLVGVPLFHPTPESIGD
ncbi:MAG: SMP-30/gluconolactonase/LRE family protein [Chloroflexota bacterium]